MDRIAWPLRAGWGRKNGTPRVQPGKGRAEMACRRHPWIGRRRVDASRGDSGVTF